jgi:hypothetical protein
VKELVSEINSMGDYADLKRELSVFRSIEVSRVGSTIIYNAEVIPWLGWGLCQQCHHTR